MKEYPNIDYGQRPGSYWEDPGVLASLVRNVKGTQRRRMIAASLEAGAVAELPEELLQDTLSELAREQLGQIHPSFMGGEYLPDCEAEEVEIVRIELESTTSDVISIRARWTGKRIRYRVVDEYPGDYTYVLTRQSSSRPLSLRELVQFLDESRQEGTGSLSLGFNESIEEYNGNRRNCRDFTRISSVFYPELEEHYEQVFEDWVREWEKEREAEDDD